MKRFGIAILLASSLFTLNAHAAEPRAKAYAGLGLGLVNFAANKSSIPSLSATSSVDSNSYNLNLFAGYQLDPFLGFEIDYIGKGGLTATDQGQTTKLFDVDLTTVAATIGTAVNDNIRIYTKLGGTFWNFSSQQNVKANDGFGPSVGFGADINLYGGDDRKLRIEYNYYHLDRVFVKDASNLSINAVFYLPAK